MRRALAGLAAVAAVLLLTPDFAAAAPEDWEGSAVTTTAATNPSPIVQARFIRRSWPENHRAFASTTVTTPGGQATGCTPAPPNPPTTVAWDGGAYVVEATVPTTCNGSYGLSFNILIQSRDCLRDLCGPWSTADQHTVTGTIAVAAPAPAVDARTEDGAGRSVVVRWDAVGNPPPDFLGFRVERRAGGGAWSLVQSIDDPAGTTTSATDASPPASGGAVDYRVVTRRAGPGGEVTNASGSTDTADVEAVPGAPPPGDPAGPGGGPSSPGGDPTTPGGTGQPGGSGGDATGGSAGGRPSRGRIQAPRLGITGTFLPPLLQPRISPVQGRASTTTTVDDGFSEDLPYDPREADEELGGDEEAAMVLGTEVPGRGLAIPIATGLVLAVWAFHLRFLARASRP